MSTKTSRTISTTGQTGHLFTTSFKAGFLERNKDLLKGGSFVEEPLRGIEAFPKGGDGPWVYKKNEEGLIMKNQKLGDIDVKVFLRSAATVRDLFPSSGVQISNPTLELPEDTLLLIELTSMAGNDVIKETSSKSSKVGVKKQFYEDLVLQYAEELGQLSTNVHVIFVYNGADFVSMSRHFQSNFFSSTCVHFPIEFCSKWEAIEQRDAEHEKRIAVEQENERLKAEHEKRIAVEQENERLKAELQKFLSTNPKKRAHEEIAQEE